MTKKILSLFEHHGNLYRNPVLYDLVVNTPEAELEFYLKHARRLGSNVLELAYGTGRVSLQLAKRDLSLNCDGVDISKEMLAYARRKYQNRFLPFRYE